MAIAAKVLGGLLQKRNDMVARMNTVAWLNWRHPASNGTVGIQRMFESTPVADQGHR